MYDALEEHDKVSIGGRNITNLRFANDALAEEEQELEALVESLYKTCTRYKFEISAEKTKQMTNSANGIQGEIKVKRQKLGTVTSFKYLGAVVSDDGSKPEILSRIRRSSDLAKTILRGTVKGQRNKRQTEEEVRRQYQRVDRNGLCQLS